MNRYRDNLVPSAHADAIYHADLYVINGRGWMIGGAGKSRAAQIASAFDPAADLGRGSVAIIRAGQRLYGRYDPGAVPADPVECGRRHPLRRLDAVAYCMSEAETALAYAGRPYAIARVDNKLLAWMLANAIYPAELAPFYFGRDQLARFLNCTLRVTRFLQLTEGAAGVEFLVLPWMPTVEAKAALYTGYGFSPSAAKSS